MSQPENAAPPKPLPVQAGEKREEISADDGGKLVRKLAVKSECLIWICNKNGCRGDMVWQQNMDDPTDPNLNVHICDECGRKASNELVYPHIHHMPIYPGDGNDTRRFDRKKLKKETD